MESTDVQVRPARLGDEAGIANVHINSWREAYVGHFPQDFLDRLPLSFHRRMEMWRSCLMNADSQTHLFVAENSLYGIVGFSAVSPARDADLEGWGELTCLYLMQPFHGRGLGFRLLGAAFTDLVQRGFPKAYCWVLKGNPTEIFYAKTGGQRQEREKTEFIQNVEVREVLMQWPEMMKKVK